AHDAAAAHAEADGDPGVQHLRAADPHAAVLRDPGGGRGSDRHGRYRQHACLAWALDRDPADGSTRDAAGSAARPAELRSSWPADHRRAAVPRGRGPDRRGRHGQRAGAWPSDLYRPGDRPRSGDHETSATSTDVVIVLASATTRRARGTSSASPGLPLLDVGQNVPTPLAAFGQGRMAQGPPELAQQRFADWGVAASGTSRARGRMTATSTNIVIAATVSNRGARGRSTSTPSVFVQAIGTTRKARGYATATGASILDVGQYVAPAHLFGGRPGPPILREQEFTQGVATPVITGSANGRGRARGTASSTCIVFASATTKRARGRGT